MFEPLGDPEPLASVEASPPRGRPLLAWAVIGIVVLGVAVLQALRSETGASSGKATLDVVLMQAQGRYLVGANTLPGASSDQLYEQARTLNTGPLPKRLRFLTLAGELAGAEEALHQLDDLERRLTAQGVEPTPTEIRTLADLRALYTDYQHGRFDAPSLDEAGREQLRQELGWFGDLALTPQQDPDEPARADLMRPARHTMLLFIGVVILVGIAGLAGLGGLATLFILWMLGRLKGGLAPGRSPGGIYAETFALWMVLYLVLELGAALAPVGRFRLLAAGIAAVLSLGVLVWPVFRGIPWRQVRQDIGWVPGRWGALEPFLGPVCYVISFPLVFLALLVVMTLLAVQNGLGPSLDPADRFTSGTQPGHPIIEFVARGGWRGWVQVFLVAAVVAPVVEETMFRGVFYRHLREATGWFGPALSVLVSATVCGFIFAVIHPQGLIAVPLLMALAFGFTIAREWRNTLAPAIVAHGINNALVTVFSIMILGG